MPVHHQDRLLRPAAWSNSTVNVEELNLRDRLDDMRSAAGDTALPAHVASPVQEKLMVRL